VYAWNTAIRERGVSPQDLSQLLTMFKENPFVDLVQREGRQFKINAEACEKSRQEAETRRIEQERQAKINEQK
jgi:multidrug efflux pump subunit AcrB